MKIKLNQFLKCMQTAQINRGLHIKSSCALHRELFLNITIMSRNLLHLPTSVNSHQDTVSHILVVHQWQVCLMHNLIRVWFSNSFLLPSSQCEAYSLHWRMSCLLLLYPICMNTHSAHTLDWRKNRLRPACRSQCAQRP